MSQPGRYRFPPLQRRGLLAGWSGPELIAVSLALVAAVLGLRLSPSLWGMAAALAETALAIVAAKARLHGRTPLQWLPVVTSWAAALVTGGRVRAAATPFSGAELAAPASPAPGGAPPARGEDATAPRAGTSTRRRSGAPAPFATLEVRAPAPRAGCRRLGIVRDGAAGTSIGVLSLRSESLELLDEAERSRRAAAWVGALRAVAAGSRRPYRLAWIERRFPVTLGAFDRCPEKAGAPRAAVRSYRRLLDEEAIAWEHEVLVSVAIAHGPRAHGVQRAEHDLADLLADAQRELLAAGLGPVEQLGVHALVRCLRRSWSAPAPGDDPGMDARAQRVPPMVWPMAVEESWKAIRTDDLWHALWWIAEWPQMWVGTGVLSPLLRGCPVRRAMAVTLEPVEAARAVREAEQSRTAELADGELLRRGGYVSSARRRKEREESLRRGDEIASGHATFRASGFLDVAAPTPEALERDCARLQQAASRAQLELRRLYGQQAEALLATLPICRGLR